MKATKEFVQERFDKFNRLCFNGELPAIPIIMSKAKSFLGKVEYKGVRNFFGKVVSYNDFKMRVSTYFNLDESELEDVVIHEMIHYYIAYRNIKDTSAHGKVFRSMVRDINKRYGRHIFIRYKPDPARLTIRRSTLADLPQLMMIYREAREIMLSIGNIHQWGPGTPAESVIRADIEKGNNYVVENYTGPVGAFSLVFGDDPTYQSIEGGEWVDDSTPYATIHRLASTKASKGVAQACFEWCSTQSPNLRVDTHEDNAIMRHCIEKAGFRYCGIIHLLNGDPRLAYQRVKTRLEQIADFCLEIDKEKEIVRRTYIASGARFENDAEHAWHMAVMALLLSDYANEKVDVLRVVSILLVHDLVEVYAGDTFAYDEEGKKTQRQRELAAADKLFAQLPSDLAVRFRGLWDEFEAWDTPESKFAHTLDNMQPLMLQNATGGRAWREGGRKLSEVLKRNERTAEGSEALWQFARSHYIDPQLASGSLAK